MAESGTSNHRLPQADSFSSRRTLPSGHRHQAEGQALKNWESVVRGSELSASGQAETQRQSEWAALRRGFRHQTLMPGTKRFTRTEQVGSGAIPGEIGGEREAGADRCPKVEILRT